MSSISGVGGASYAPYLDYAPPSKKEDQPTPASILAQPPDSISLSEAGQAALSSINQCDKNQDGICE